MRVRGGAWVVVVALATAACAEHGSFPDGTRRLTGAQTRSTALALQEKLVFAGEPSLPPLATAPDPFAYDARAPLNATETAGRGGATYSTTNVTYQTYDGTVPGRFWAPLVPAPYPCVLFAHGVTSDKDGDSDIRDRLVAAGYAMFSIDARFHGERGSPQAFEEIRFYPGRARELFQGTVVDLRRALDYLGQRRDCAPGRIGFIGGSMGGFMGAMLAGVDDRVTAPVLLFSGGDWRTWFTAGHPGAVGVFYLYGNAASLDATVAALDPLDPVYWVGRISPRPVLMVHGDADDVVPPASAQALYDAAQDPRMLFWYHGGHGPGPAEGARVTQVVGDWLNQYLSPG